VQICGHTSRRRFDGCQGTLLFRDPASGRWRVRLDVKPFGSLMVSSNMLVPSEHIKRELPANLGSTSATDSGKDVHESSLPRGAPREHGATSSRARAGKHPGRLQVQEDHRLLVRENAGPLCLTPEPEQVGSRSRCPEKLHGLRRYGEGGLPRRRRLPPLGSKTVDSVGSEILAKVVLGSADDSDVFSPHSSIDSSGNQVTVGISAQGDGGIWAQRVANLAVPVPCGSQGRTSEDRSHSPDSWSAAAFCGVWAQEILALRPMPTEPAG